MSLLQLLTPKKYRGEILQDLHEGILGGHLGQDKVLGKLRERFYWPRYHNDVRDWVLNCQECCKRKTPALRNRAPLQSIKVGYPMQLVATDILGPLPESGGNSYILVVGDYFTRWTEAYPIPNQEAATVAKKLTEEFFFRFSPPEQLHTDQGRQFESELVSEICKLLGIAKTHMTPYYPQSDGLIERFNRTLLSMLATTAAERPFDWEEYLRPLCMAYNTSVQATTGYTPFSLMFGRQARMPIDLMYGTPDGVEQSPSQYASNLRSTLENAYRRVREQTGTQLDRQKDFYDARVHGKPYSEGQLVWFHSPVVPKGTARKFHRPWTGPYKVVKRINDTTYRIEDVQARRRRKVVHFDRLKPCPPGVRLTPRSPLPAGPPAAQHPGTEMTLLPPDDEPPPPRYPQRERHPPDYLQPVVRHT